MLEMSVGPRMSGRLETVTGLPLLPLPLLPLPRAAFKSGRLDGIGGGAVLLPERNGVPESELGSRTLVGTGGGGGRWFGMYGGAWREGADCVGGGPWLWGPWP